MPTGARTETRAPTAACAPRETRARRGAAPSRSSGGRSTEGRSRAPCTRAPPPGPHRSSRSGSARSPWRARRSRARRAARPSRSAAAAHRPARARRGTSRGDRATPHAAPSPKARAETGPGSAAERARRGPAPRRQAHAPCRRLEARITQDRHGRLAELAALRRRSRGAWWLASARGGRGARLPGALRARGSGRRTRSGRSGGCARRGPA
jgi:hypothetical protein